MRYHARTHLPHGLALALAIALTSLAGCHDEATEAAAQAQAVAAQAAASEQAAKQNADGFDDAVSAENWALAKAQGDVLFANYPNTEAAKRIKPQYEEAKAKAVAAREAMRVASLWSYNIETVPGGKQLSSAIYAKEDLDTDGSGSKQVRLIFRDHPSWGRSSYLILQAGDFDCYGGCKVKVTIDDGPAKSMAALRPKTDEAIAMFINDDRALWKMIKGADRLSVEFPVKAGGTRTAVFEVAGLDRSKLPKWN